MRRRQLLKAAGVAGAAVTATGVGLYTSSGEATASAGSTISDPEAATTDDGEIQWVATQTTGRLTWDGFDEPAVYGRIIVDVEQKRDGSTLWTGQIHDTEMIDLRQGDSWGTEGDAASSGQEGFIASDADWGICQRDREHHYNDGYGLPENPAPVNRMFAQEDGSTQQTRVVLGSEYRLYDADGNELTGTSGYPSRPTASSDFVVTVNNQEATTSFGDADAQGDTGDSAEVGTATATETDTPSP